MTSPIPRSTVIAYVERMRLAGLVTIKGQEPVVTPTEAAKKRTIRRMQTTEKKHWK
jgi:hypothetical protein